MTYRDDWKRCTFVVFWVTVTVPRSSEFRIGQTNRSSLSTRIIQVHCSWIGDVRFAGQFDSVASPRKTELAYETNRSYCVCTCKLWNSWEIRRDRVFHYHLASWRFLAVCLVARWMEGQHWRKSFKGLSIHSARHDFLRLVLNFLLQRST